MEAFLLGQAQARPGYSKLGLIAVGELPNQDFGYRLTTRQEAPVHLKRTKCLSTPPHGARHQLRAISRTSLVLQDASLDCSVPASLGYLQGPRSSCDGTSVVWSEDGMERGTGCIKFKTALRIHFRKDQAPPPILRPENHLGTCLPTSHLF